MRKLGGNDIVIEGEELSTNKNKLIRGKITLSNEDDNLIKEVEEPVTTGPGPRIFLQDDDVEFDDMDDEDPDDDLDI